MTVHVYFKNVSFGVFSLFAGVCLGRNGQKTSSISCAVMTLTKMDSG